MEDTTVSNSPNNEKSSLPTSEESSTNAPKRQIRGLSWLLVITSVLSSMLIYSLDNTITADLVPAIVNDFDSVPLLPWLSVGFMVGAMVSLLPVGKLYSKYNAKWVYIINVVVFLASSALCGAAPNMNAIIVGRVFLGLSGAGMYGGVLTLVSAYTDDHERPGYLSLIGFVWGIGTVLGPVVGGAFATVDWRWSFYINLIIGGVFIPVYLFLLPPFDPLPNVSMLGRLEKYDFLGVALYTGFILSLIMAINFGGAVYAWDSGSEIALFVVSGVLFIAFAVQQRFAWFTTTAERIFPVKMLRSVEANLLFVCAACSNAAGYIPIFYIPVYFQFSRGDSALDAAVRLLPLIIVLSFTIVANGFLMGKLGYYFPWYFLGSALALAGNVLLSRVDIDTSTARIYGYEVLVAIGSGAFIQAGYATIQTVVPPSEMGYALPFMMVAQYSGIALGLAVSGAVFINRALTSLQALLPMVPTDQLNALISGTSSTAINAVPEELRAQTFATIVESLREVFIPAYAAAALSLVLSFFINKRKAFNNVKVDPIVA